MSVSYVRLTATCTLIIDHCTQVVKEKRKREYAHGFIHSFYNSQKFILRVDTVRHSFIVIKIIGYFFRFN